MEVIGSGLGRWVARMTVVVVEGGEDGVGVGGWIEEGIERGGRAGDRLWRLQAGVVMEEERLHVLFVLGLRMGFFLVHHFVYLVEEIEDSRVMGVIGEGYDGYLGSSCC